MVPECSRAIQWDDSADRAYWEKRGLKATVALVDQLLPALKDLDPSLELKYNKFYIGLSKAGQPYNFVQFRPKKNLNRLSRSSNYLAGTFSMRSFENVLAGRGEAVWPRRSVTRRSQNMGTVLLSVAEAVSRGRRRSDTASQCRDGGRFLRPFCA